jgi:hypothetical protein
MLAEAFKIIWDEILGSVIEWDFADKISHPIDVMVAADEDEIAVIVGNLGPDTIGIFVKDLLDIVPLCTISFVEAAIVAGVIVEVVLLGLEA